MVFSEDDVLHARDGDQDAFIRLIQTYETSLYRVAKGILKEDSICADAIQEAILKSYKSISKLKNPKYFKTWITRILINECNDILKKKHKDLSHENIESLQDMEADVKENCDLTEAISELDEKHRAVVTLFYYEEFSIKEISQILKISEGTVKSRLNRARLKLSSYLNLQNPEERGVENG